MRDIAYLSRLHREPPPLLLECEQQGTYDRIPMVDRTVGQLLSVLVHCMQANRILEIGTAYGYATLWMALALPPAGHIWTIDPDTSRADIASGYLERAGKGGAVEFINQPALEVLPTFYQRNLDIVFIDADMTEYEAYLELCVPMLKRSGLIVVGDLLRNGTVADEPSPDDSADVKALRAFSKTFINHPQLDATIVPIGDGLGIGARID
ncbi:MAG: O-methyltransferase [Candidatus Lustribacter sp.]